MSWHLGSESLSFNDFIANMRNDVGHPYLWFYILYLISHFITPNPESTKIIHLIISTISVFLILKYAPFNKILRVMMIFGYFFFYEYSIISRNYALGILFIILFCVLYKNKYKYILPIVIVLFFMGQVNIYSFIISLTLFLMLSVDLIIDRKYVAKHVKKLYIIFAVLIFIGEILLMYWQLGAPVEAGTIFSSPISTIFKKSTEDYIRSLQSISNGIISAYIPIPRFILNFWNSNIIIHSLSTFKFLYTYIVASILIFIPVLIIKRRYIFLFIIGTLGILLVPFFVYIGYLRHYGHLFILFIACLWLSNINKNEKHLINFKGKANKILQTTILVIILIPSLIASSVAFYYDWKYPFSNGKYVAEYIEENFNKDEIMIVGYPDYITETISGYLDKDFYYPNSKNIKKLVDLSNRIDNPNNEKIFSEANSFADEYSQILVINWGPVAEPEIPVNYYLLDTFSDAIVSSENYYLYLFNKDNIMNQSNLIHEIDYSNFDDYWIPMIQCKFVIKDKTIHILTEGEDPHFESIFPIEFKEEKPLIMVIHIESLVEARFQVFYKRTGYIYNEEDSQFFTLLKGNNNIYIGIPYSEDLESIRIDPVDENQNCIIEKIEFYSLEE